MTMPSAVFDGDLKLSRAFPSKREALRKRTRPDWWRMTSMTARSWRNELTIEPCQPGKEPGAMANLIGRSRNRNPPPAESFGREWRNGMKPNKVDMTNLPLRDDQRLFRTVTALGAELRRQRAFGLADVSIDLVDLAYAAIA